jgi:prepilin-type N-terminal cleavage/methylation domain-containing protein
VLGFSLLELVITIAILVIISSVGYRVYGTSLTRYRADAAARRVANDLNLAQSRAYSRSAAQSVVFDVPASSYQITGMNDINQPTQPYVVQLSGQPYYATINSASFAGSPIAAFDVYGMPASPGTIVVTVGATTRTITVDQSSGRATVQ